MTLISHRECHLIELKNPQDIDEVVEEIKTFLKEEENPEGYTIDVYKDAAACCGYFPIGVAIEIEGAEKQPIENLDVKIYSKIIEICEREGIEHHKCEPLEVVHANS